MQHGFQADGWEIACERPRGKGRPLTRVYVSLNRRGEIVMNARAFSSIREPASVALFYYAAPPADEASQPEGEPKRGGAIGIKCPVAADRNFFPVRRYGRGRRMRIVRAARLLKQFGIEIERTLVFVNPERAMLRGEPMLILRLDEGLER